MIHTLKEQPQYFERVFSGEMTFEVRKDDRGFQFGDKLVLKEWIPGDSHPNPKEPKLVDKCHDPECQYRYTGRVVWFDVGFVFKQGFGADFGEYVVLSLLNRLVPNED